MIEHTDMRIENHYGSGCYGSPDHVDPKEEDDDGPDRVCYYCGQDSCDCDMLES